MDTVPAARHIVLARNAANDQEALGMFKSKTDADVFIAEQLIRNPGLSFERKPHFGVRQAAAVCADLLARATLPPTSDSSTG